MSIQPGDRMWVREEHYLFGHWEIDPTKCTKSGHDKWCFVPDSDEVRNEAPSEFRKGRSHRAPGTPAWHKRLGRFMFRRHSRLTLYVTEVRVQRLQEISEEDARAEGFVPDEGLREVGLKPTARGSFSRYWTKLHGSSLDRRTQEWAANPWVAAYTFQPRLGNIDSLPATLMEEA